VKWKIAGTRDTKAGYEDLLDSVRSETHYIYKRTMEIASSENTWIEVGSYLDDLGAEFVLPEASD
jgi:hypothetical protein